LADQKISELTALTGANVADDDAIAIVDTSATETKKIVFSELKNALDTATGFVRITGDTMTGNLSMGDNVKAIFGAGSDLQIYHNAAHSVIEDVGQGDIYLNTNGAKINIYDSGNTQFLARFNAGTDVELYYNGDEKLATTATGIDVTGTITSDGLTVDTNTLHVDATNNRVGIGTDSPKTELNIAANNSGQGAKLTIENSDTSITNGDILGQIDFYANDGSTNGTGAKANIRSVVESAAGTLVGLAFGTSNSASATAVEAMRIDNSGNVGIGTDSPAYNLHVSGSEGILRLSSTSSGTNFDIGSGSAGQTFLFQRANSYMHFGTNNTERMRIDSSGNVIIGDTSNNGRKFRVKGSGDLVELVSTNAGAGGAQLDLKHESASAANGDLVGIINFSGLDSGGINTQYASIQGVASDISAETGELRLGVRENGSSYNADAVVIDSSGNVGIGTSSPATKLDFGITTNDTQIVNLRKNSNSIAGLGVNSEYGVRIAGPSDAAAPVSFGEISISDGTTFSESMRIDSSGNLLVSKTSVNSGVVGVEAKANGTLVATVDGDTVSLLNRKTNDGEILRLQKDSTTVGSIGVDAGDNLYIGSTAANHGGIYMNDSGVLPA
jgi:hypothetical protein